MGASDYTLNSHLRRSGVLAYIPELIGLAVVDVPVGFLRGELAAFPGLGVGAVEPRIGAVGVPAVVRAGDLGLAAQIAPMVDAVRGP